MTPYSPRLISTRFGPIARMLRARAHDVALAAEQARLLVVDDEDADAREQRLERRRATRRSSGSWCRSRRGAARASWSSTDACSAGSMLARKTNGAVAIARRQLRLEVGEDVELEVQRVAHVHVLVVAARPAQRRARRAPRGRRGRCRAAAGRRARAAGKSSPTDADHVHRREEARRHREVGRGAAERRRRRVPCGVSMVSIATEPTTSRLMRSLPPQVLADQRMPSVRSRFDARRDARRGR